MGSQQEVSFLPSEGDSRSADIDRLRETLGSPDNPFLFPPHFLKATFPKIGGQIILVERENRVIGVGFLFPRIARDGVREYTLRFHKAHPEAAIDQSGLVFKVEELLGNKVVFYDPQSNLSFERNTLHRQDEVDFGRPDASEARSIRALQQEIWRGDLGFVYPSDIHSSIFRTGTSLVARVRDEPVGFLFGFYKFGGDPLPDSWDQKFQGRFRIESQLLGVLSKHRGLGIGFHLKKLQAINALNEGIGLINWTVDPLQYHNAVLNYGGLRALALDFHPNYYSFRNVLNQVTASRFGITWLVRTEGVKHALSMPSRQAILNLDGNTEIPRVNKGFEEMSLEEDARTLAIEIPAAWTRLQKENLQQARRWREITDKIFGHYIGHEEGKYIVKGVGEDGDRKYLIAERAGQALYDELAR